MIETETCYRLTGPEEFRLLEESAFRRWPPRLPAQPIFYAVTNQQYAHEIHARWTVKVSRSEYVTRFQVRRSFLDSYQVQCVGAEHHTEWWIPAEDLEALNDNILGTIEVIASAGE